jgi:uncharacterized protein (TIGR02145 family)
MKNSSIGYGPSKLKHMKDLAKISVFSFTLLVLLSILFGSCKKKDNNPSNPAPEIVTDIELNIYHTVKIGTQIWMVENLRTRTYNDGDTVPMLLEYSVTDTTPRYIWYNNNDFIYRFAYGALYNWYAVNTGKLAPKGWHVASYNEWMTLINYLGGASVAGGKMKTKGDLQHGDGLWWPPNTGATNESGFSAFPAGECRVMDSIWFNGNNTQAHWWSSTREHNFSWPFDFPWSFEVIQDTTSIRFLNHWPGNMLYSVRCIKN